MRLAKRIWPIALLILCAPVWFRSALEINLCAAEVFGKAFSKVKRRGSTDEFREIVGEFALKLRVVLRAKVFGLQFLQRVHQRLGNVTSAILAEVALGVG
jgi:hypothetical protein